MALTSGTRLGAYEVIALLGAGGMGEVYRARDTRLKREVAIKILPDAFAADPDRLARFQREAELLATLNHPNIAAVYGLERSGDVSGIVLELVEGETLAERIQRGTLPAGAAINIAVQIAEALEAAHERGVIHRDLKPANIKITADDRVKVLDFGLAKVAATQDSSHAGTISHSPTLSMMATHAGVILGTAAYMSPEQASGQPVDHRSDIFAFGVILYEMLTGRSPFHADTAAEILASVIVREADLSRLPADLHPRFRDLIRRCLEKRSKQRWQAIGDVRAELEAIRAAPTIHLPAAVLPSSVSRWKFAASVLIAASVGGAIVALVGSMRALSATRPVVTRFPIVLSDGQRFTNTGRRAIAISPDGARLVYVANQQLYLREMDELQSRPIVGTAFVSVTSPVFSPDGAFVAFATPFDDTLRKIAVTGGISVTIAPGTNPLGMDWAGDHIYFGQTKGIFRVSASGGIPQLVVAAGPDEELSHPHMMPDGRTVVFTAVSPGPQLSRWDSAKIVSQSQSSGERKVLVSGGSDGQILPTGHLIYARRGVTFAVAFDAAAQAVVGGPVPLIEGVGGATAGGLGGGGMQLSIASNGSLAFIPGPVGAGGGRALAHIDATGSVRPLKFPAGLYEAPRYSPDGRQIAVGTDDGKDSNVWIGDPSGISALRRLTFGGRNRYPIWSPDGRRVAFQSDRDGDLAIFAQRADGTGSVERLTRPERDVEHRPDSWSPDGQHMFFTAVIGSSAKILTFRFADHQTMLFAEAGKSFVGKAALSPNGRWVSYSSNETGRQEIFVQPFPATGNRYQIGTSQTGRTSSWWSPDGRRLYFNEGATDWFAVDVSTQPSFTFGPPQQIPRPGATLNLGAAGPRPYDMSGDGQNMLAVVPAIADAPGPRRDIEIVLNWFEELKQRVPTK